MKAVLEFNLPDDRSEFKSACDSGKWESILWRIDQELRTTAKHCADPKEADFASKLRKQIANEMEAAGVVWTE